MEHLENEISWSGVNDQWSVVTLSVGRTLSQDIGPVTFLLEWCACLVLKVRFSESSILAGMVSYHIPAVLKCVAEENQSLNGITLFWLEVILLNDDHCSGGVLFNGFNRNVR